MSARRLGVGGGWSLGGCDTLCSTYHYLHPTPYTLHPTPHTLHPTPYTLHRTPYTLHPTPYTLHPTLETSCPTYHHDRCEREQKMPGDAAQVSTWQAPRSSMRGRGCSSPRCRSRRTSGRTAFDARRRRRTSNLPTPPPPPPLLAAPTQLTLPRPAALPACDVAPLCYAATRLQRCLHLADSPHHAPPKTLPALPHPSSRQRTHVSKAQVQLLPATGLGRGGGGRDKKVDTSQKSSLQ